VRPISGSSGRPVLLLVDGLVGGEFCRESPHFRAVYRRRSLCVALISTPWGDSIFGHTFWEAFSECKGGMVIRTSYNELFIARILSVVHAIQPQPGSSLCSVTEDPGVVAAALAIRKSSSNKGISWTPIENSGRSRWGGAVEASRSLTAKGMFERTEISYTTNC
jgi:hypothetical protein